MRKIRHILAMFTSTANNSTLIFFAKKIKFQNHLFIKIIVSPELVVRSQVANFFS